MQAQVDIGFDQLVQLAKRLPATQWTKLKQEVEKEQNPKEKEREEFKKLLLSGPTFSKKQLDAVAETRKRINQWRTTKSSQTLRFSSTTSERQTRQTLCG